jgi:hypothetical protein
VLGWAADRFGSVRVLRGLGLGIAAAAGAAIAIGPAMPVPAVLGIAGLFGFAAFGWNGICLAEAARLAPPGGVAAATAGTMMLIYAGACLGPALFGAALATFASPAPGFLLLAAAALVPLLWLRRR